MTARFSLENGHMRLKQCRHGLMLYNINDFYMGRAYDKYGEDQERELRFLAGFLRPGQVVLDVGANIGTHTVFFSRCVGDTGRVLSFEPQPVIFHTLCANVALNALTNVRSLWSGVDRSPGQIRIPPIDYEKMNNFGGISFKGQEAGEPVMAVTIDSLGLRACHFMKIDVEGMEGDVLAGAEQTIAAFRPGLFIENNDKEQSSSLIEALFRLGYRCYWCVAPLWNPSNYFNDSQNIFGKVCTINMMCVHESSPVSMGGLTEIVSADSNWEEAWILGSGPYR